MSDALFALCTAEAERDHVSDWAAQRLLEKRQEITTENDDQVQALAELWKNSDANGFLNF